MVTGQTYDLLKELDLLEPTTTKLFHDRFADLYLQRDGCVAVGPLTLVRAFPFSDIDGLLIQQGGSGPAESDLTQYQNWRTVTQSEDLALVGTVTVDLWAAAKHFSATSTGSLVVYLRDYNGATSTEIASSTVLAGPWDPGATGSFLQKSVSLSTLDYTVVAGNSLEIKVIVGSGADADMWLAYDTLSYPAKIALPEALRRLTA